MPEIVVAKVIGLVFSGVILVLSTILNGMRKSFKHVKMEQESFRLGMQALLRDRIVQAYNHHCETGYVPIYARENIEEMYRQYKNLGGNGVVKDLVHRIMNLPTHNENKEE